MADKIDQLKIGTTSYDIDLPPDATPSVASLTASGAITGGTIVKSGGTSSQFLKADGSVDSNTYVKLNGSNTGSGDLAYEQTETTESVTTTTGTYIAPDFMGAYKQVSTGTPPSIQYGLNIDATSFSYNDTLGDGHTCVLTFGNSGTIATTDDIKNGTLTIQKNGTNVQTFTANQSSNVTANITVPTAVGDLTNDRYVRYDTSSQGLTSTQKSNARTNIGASNLSLGTTATTAAYGNHLYHYWTTNQYYNDSYSGEKNWRMMTESVLADTLRWKAGTIANKEYWDYDSSSWKTSSLDFSNLFNGNYNDGVNIPYAQRKFRFTMTASSGWGTTTMVCLEGSWYNAGTVSKVSGTDAYVIVTIETRASASDSWATKVTASFPSNCMNKQALCVPSSALHTGHSLYRITVELGAWTSTSNSASLRRLMILSNYAGSSLTPFSYDGSGKVTAMNTLNAITLQEDGTNLTSKYQAKLPTTTTAGKVLKSTSTAGTVEWGDVSHQSIKTLDTTATAAQDTNANEAITGSGKITLHKVSKTGNYNDLIGTPTIPTSDSSLINDKYVAYTANQGLTSTQQNNARINIDAQRTLTTTVVQDGDLINAIGFDESGNVVKGSAAIPFATETEIRALFGH